MCLCACGGGRWGWDGHKQPERLNEAQKDRKKNISIICASVFDINFCVTVSTYIQTHICITIIKTSVCVCETEDCIVDVYFEVNLFNLNYQTLTDVNFQPFISHSPPDDNPMFLPSPALVNRVWWRVLALRLLYTAMRSSDHSILQCHRFLRSFCLRAALGKEKSLNYFKISVSSCADFSIKERT